MRMLTGVPAILAIHAPTGTQGRSNAELNTAIQELLDKGIKRSIANHSRKISIVDVRQKKAFHHHERRLPRCASSQVTLRQRFEVMLKRVAQKIAEIVDMTNHAAGKQLFYPRYE